MTNSDLYPKVTKCLLVLLDMPVSTASAERPFSIMRRLKTYLRSTMGTERLPGLWLLNIHREREISSEQVVDVFCPKEKQTYVVLVPSINECMGRIETVSILVFLTMHIVFSLTDYKVTYGKWETMELCESKLKTCDAAWIKVVFYVTVYVHEFV